MLCYSGKNTQTFQVAFYTSSIEKPHQSGVQQGGALVLDGTGNCQGPW